LEALYVHHTRPRLFLDILYRRRQQLFLCFVKNKASQPTSHNKHRTASLKYFKLKYLSLALLLGSWRLTSNSPELVFIENGVMHVPEFPCDFSVYVKRSVQTMDFSFKIVRERIQLPRLRPNPLFPVNFSVDIGRRTLNLPIAETVEVPVLLSVAIPCYSLVVAEFSHKVILLPSLHFLMTDFTIFGKREKLFCGLHLCGERKIQKCSQRKEIWKQRIYFVQNIFYSFCSLTSPEKCSLLSLIFSELFGESSTPSEKSVRSLSKFEFIF